MIKQISIFFILVVLSNTLKAQTIKTGVLVIGNTPGSISASIQSARSGAKTILLTQSLTLSARFTEEDLPYIANIKNYYALKDKKNSKLIDSITAAKVSLDETSPLIKSITDTVNNLTLNLNNAIDQIEKDGKGWEIRLKGGQKIKADVLVDATENLSIASMLRIDNKKTMAIPGATSNPFDNKLYRSTVAYGYMEKANIIRSVYTIPLGSLIPLGVENLVLVPNNIAGIRPSSMSLGQAAGTVASYCAFFKTNTKNINIRLVQGELLTFSALLIPYTDIKLKDPNFLALQRIGLSGLLTPGMVKDGDLHKIRFDTAGIVTANQLKNPMKEFYSRSQIWFADNKKDTLSIYDAISLFMFTGARGEELKKEIEEGWKMSFNLSSDFNLKRDISRKEFAILADRYLQPYNVRIDFAGNLLQ